MFARTAAGTSRNWIKARATATAMRWMAMFGKSSTAKPMMPRQHLVVIAWCPFGRSMVTGMLTETQQVALHIDK
tara:strand:- start:116 stop:337 length:222 start_codon:yes stop_codon:yes gene_type:complete